MLANNDLVTLDERVKLESRIEERQRNEANESMLAEGVHGVLDLFSGKDKRSLAHLKELGKTASSNAEIETALSDDHKAADWRDTVSQVSTSFVKTVPLFMGSGKGLVTAALLYGADQARPSTGADMMALDFTLGAVKGVGTKLLLDKFSANPAPLWQKGALLGGSMSALDSTLSSSTWYNAQSGQWHAGEGLKSTLASTLLGAGTGAVVFPLGMKLSEGVSSAGQRVLGRNFNNMLATMSVGGSFGLVSGSAGELQRQISSGEHIDASKIVRGAVIEGITDMAAAGTGYGLGKVTFTQTPIDVATTSGAPTDSNSTTKQALDSNRLTEFSSEDVAKTSQWLQENPQRLFDLATRVAQNDATVDGSSTRAVEENADLAKLLTGPQIRDGLRSVLLSENPSSGLDFLMKTGVMQRMLPEVAAMTGPGSEQSWQFHSEGNVWQHTERVLNNTHDSIEGLSPDEQFKESLAALLHDMGKMQTQTIAKDGRISNPGHAELGAEQARALLQRLEVDPQTSEAVVSIIRDHMKMHTAPTMRASRLNELLGNPEIEAKIRLQAADATGSISGTPPDGQKAPKVWGSNEEFLLGKLAAYRAKLQAKANEPVPLLNARMLLNSGVAQGSELGTILKAAKQAQTDGTLTSSADLPAWLQETFNVALATSGSDAPPSAVPPIDAADAAISARINSAIDATRAFDPQYLDKTLLKRTVEPAGSRYNNMTPAQLEAAIRSANWQPYNNPVIQAPAVGFRAALPGRLGMTPIDALPDDTLFNLIDPKATGNWSLATTGTEGQEVPFSTLIVGPSGDRETIYTVHPGEPTRPSTLSQLPPEIGSRLPASGERRIPLSKAEAQGLGYSLAKIEDQPQK